MLSYRFDRLQDDGTWSVQEFQSINDQEAISYGLSIRTANRCELYQAHRWLATFDGATASNDNSPSPPIESTNPSFAWTCLEVETEAAYFHRRALEEKQRGLNEASAAARLAYLSMADYLESLARAVEAEGRRRNFYDVNASRDEAWKIPPAAGERTNRKICYSAASHD